MADLSEMWDDAKKKFEEMTGKKKPRESKGISNAFGLHTGLSGALAKFDKVFNVATKAPDRTESDLKAGNKMADEMAGFMVTFKKASSSYADVLGKKIESEIDARTEKDTKTAFERALKYLKKELVSVEETGLQRVVLIRQRFDAAQANLSITAKVIKTWSTTYKAVLARGTAAAAKVKADPTPATYNSIFPTAARDITMQLVIAKKIEDLPVDPEPVLRAMNPWASQAGGFPAQLPPTASTQDVNQALGGFIAQLKLARDILPA